MLTLVIDVVLISFKKDLPRNQLTRDICFVYLVISANN